MVHLDVKKVGRIPDGGGWPDETGKTAVGFWARARALLAAHDITRITRVVTDNGSCCWWRAFTRAASNASRHQQTKPLTPKHNGTMKRCQRILAEELLYARPFTSEAARARAVQVWNVHYNSHRPHTAARNQPCAASLDLGVTNVIAHARGGSALLAVPRPGFCSDREPCGRVARHPRPGTALSPAGEPRPRLLSSAAPSGLLARDSTSAPVTSPPWPRPVDGRSSRCPSVVPVLAAWRWIASASRPSSVSRRAEQGNGA
jgi:hypothetical protein